MGSRRMLLSDEISYLFRLINSAYVPVFVDCAMRFVMLIVAFTIAVVATNMVIPERRDKNEWL